MGSVGGLYDTLHGYHHKLSKNGSNAAYTIHKRFSQDKSSRLSHFKDINDWLINTLDFSGINKVLDVGCGVGATSIAIAEAGASEVKGISLSKQELESAKSFAKSEGVSNCTFSLADMSEPLGQKYDAMVLIESIKHVKDIDRTLLNLTASLSKGGTIVIVEDLLSINESKLNYAEQFKRLWMVTDLYSEQDFDKTLNAYGLVKKDVVDFTDRVRNPLYWFLLLKFQLMNLLYKIVPSKSFKSIVSIFLGGFILDLYYEKGHMKYKAMVYKKE